jgi:hypothetical protein
VHDTLISDLSLTQQLQRSDHFVLIILGGSHKLFAWAGSKLNPPNLSSQLTGIIDVSHRPLPRPETLFFFFFPAILGLELRVYT